MLYRVSGKYNGKHYSILGYILGYIRVMGKEKGNHRG